MGQEDFFFETKKKQQDDFVHLGIDRCIENDSSQNTNRY